MSTCSLRKIGESIYLFSPYSKKLIVACKLVGGRWDKDYRGWKFDPSLENTIIEIALDFFGECNDISIDNSEEKRERLQKEKIILENRIKEIDEFLKIGDVADELLDKD